MSAWPALRRTTRWSEGALRDGGGAGPHTAGRGPDSVTPAREVPLAGAGVAEQPYEHTVRGHASEVLARVRVAPLLPRDAVGPGRRHQLLHAAAVPVADRDVMVASRDRFHVDAAGLGQELERQVRGSRVARPRNGPNRPRPPPLPLVRATLLLGGPSGPPAGRPFQGSGRHRPRSAPGGAGRSRREIG